MHDIFSDPLFSEGLFVGTTIFLGFRANAKKRLHRKTENQTKANSPISRRAAASAQRARIRERLAIAAAWGTVCPCPSCQAVDLHWMDETAPGMLKRECKACGFIWKQPTGIGNKL